MLQAKSYHPTSTLHIPCSTSLLQGKKFASNNVAIQSVDQHNPLKLLHCGAFYTTREITAHLLNEPVHQCLHVAGFLVLKIVKTRPIWRMTVFTWLSV